MWRNVRTCIGNACPPSSLPQIHTPVCGAGPAAYVRAPGMINEAQCEGWKAVTKGVHDKGGVIFAQLFHAGG